MGNKIFPGTFSGVKPALDLVEVDTNRSYCEQGKKITPRQVKKFIDSGKDINIKVPLDFIAGRFCAQDIIDEKTGKIWIEAGDELTIELDEASGELTGGNVKDIN